MIAVVTIRIPKGFEAMADGSYRAVADIIPGKSDFSPGVGTPLMCMEAEYQIKDSVVEVKWKEGEG